MTNPRNDHQPLPAPYQPAYHCSVWHRLPPVLYGHHHHSLCSTRRLTHSVGGMWLPQLLKLYAHAAPSPRSCIVPPDLSFYGKEQQELQQGLTVLTPDSLVPSCADQSTGTPAFCAHHYIPIENWISKEQSTAPTAEATGWQDPAPRRLMLLLC